MDVLRRLLKFLVFVFVLMVAEKSLASNVPFAFRKNASSTAQSFIQSGKATLTNTTPANCPYLSSFTVSSTGAGNTMIIGMTSSTSSSSNILWIIDNAGNNYTMAGTNINLDSANNQNSQIWFTQPTIANATSIQICNISSLNAVTAVWYMEVPGYWDLNNYSSKVGTTSSATISTTTISVATNKDLFVSVGAGGQNISSIKVGNTFTALPISTKFDTAYLFPGATGNYGAQWTQASSAKYVTSNVDFKPGWTCNYSFLQQAFSNPLSTTSPVSVTFPKAQSAGNLNIVSIGWWSGTSTVSSVIDSAGNTYQLAMGPTRYNSLTQYIYYATNIKGSAANSNTVTVTFSTVVPDPDVSAFEYRANSNTILGSTQAASGTGSGTSAAASVSTNNPQELVFSSAINNNARFAALDWTFGGSPFTSRLLNYNEDIMGDLITSAAGTYTFSAGGPGSFDWINSAVSFVDGNLPRAKWVQTTESMTTMSSNTYTTPAFASNTTTGNAIICTIGQQSATTPISTVTDSAGNSYIRAGTYTAVQNAGWQQDIWYKTGITGGSGITVTVTLSSSSTSYLEMSCQEYSGLPTTGALDQVISGSGPSNPSIGPLTTTSSKEFLFTYILDCALVTASPGYVTRSSQNGNLVETQNLSSIVTGYNVTAVSSTCYDTIAATFKSN